MPVHQVEAPDGQIIKVEAPEGASQADILAFAEANYKPKEPEEKESVLRQAADVPVNIAKGISQGVRMLSDAFGADNPVSANLRGVEDYLGGLLSAQAKNDQEEIAKIFKEAEDKGVLDQVKAGLKAFTVAPIDIMSQAFGTIIPTLAGGLAGQALKLGARTAAVGTGAVMGTGVGKSSIYDAVTEELKQSRLPPEAIQQAATQAQEYGGKNLDLILANTLLGGVAAGTGIERALIPGMVKNISANIAKRGVIGRGLATGAPELLTEGAQGGTEQFTQNVALQREGFDVPTFRGVGTAATMEAVAGGVLGTGIGAFSRPQEAPIAPTTEDIRAQAPDVPPAPPVAPAAPYQPLSAEEARQQSIDQQIARQNAFQSQFEQPFVAGETPDQAYARQMAQQDARTPVRQYTEPQPQSQFLGVGEAAIQPGQRERAQGLAAQEFGLNVGQARPPVTEEDRLARQLAAQQQMDADRFQQQTPLPPVTPAQAVLPTPAPIPSARGFDRQAQLLGQRAGLPQVEQVGLEAQADIAGRTGQTAVPQTRFVDLTPMPPRVARQKLAALQADAPNANLNIVPHPQMGGRFAIEERVTPIVEAAEPRRASTAMTNSEARQVLQNVQRTGIITPEVIAAERQLQDVPTIKLRSQDGVLLSDSTPANVDASLMQFAERTTPDNLLVQQRQGMADEAALNAELRGGFDTRQITNDNRTKQVTKPILGGVATPEEAQRLREQGMGRPYDQVSSLEPKAPTEIGKSQREQRLEQEFQAEQQAARATLQGPTLQGTSIGARPAPPPASTQFTEQFMKPEGRMSLASAEATPELKATLDDMRKQLLPILKRFGLEKVGLRLVGSIENGGVEGMYAQQVITLALDSDNPLGVMRHEVIHALKELGAFTPAEWKVLSKAAKDKWINQFFNRDMQDRYQRVYLEQNGNLDGFQEYLQEEAIAQAFRYFSDTTPKGALKEFQKPSGMIANLMRRLNEFFAALSNFFASKDLTVDDMFLPNRIFADIERGAITPGREQGRTEELPKYSLRQTASTDTDQDRANSLTDMRVSPRLPTSKKSQEDILGEKRLQPSLEATARDPVQFAKNVDIMSQYPNFKGVEGTPEQKVETMINDMVENLLWLHDHWKPDYRNRSKLWYVGGNRIAHRWAERFGVSPEQVAGVIAALSPQKDWFQNVSIAERILEASIKEQNTPWSSAMTNVVKSRLWGTKLSNELKFTPSEQLARFEGKTLKEMFNPDNPSLSLLDMAVWIRAWDEANNPQMARVITPEGAFADQFDTSLKGDPIALRAQSFNAMTKSLKILVASTPQQISEVIGANHKVRSFYNNIIAPYAGEDVTIDTHAVAAALLRPLGSSDTEVGHNFGAYAPSSAITGMNGTYGIYAEAYRRAAEKAGILPREMQSITWEAVRGLFKPSQKTTKTKAEVDGIWEKVANKELEAKDAREKISKLVGGITDPAWIKYPVGRNEAAQDSSYAGELPASGQPRPAPEQDKPSAKVRGAGGAKEPKFSLRAPTTPEFKQWFKGSKVVDEDGNPLVVYHATLKDFLYFDPKKLSKNTKHPTARLGFFSAADPSSTDEFITVPYGIKKGTYEDGANVMPLYASIKNPVTIPSGQFMMQSMALQNMPKKKAEKFIEDYIQSLRDEGHDGILIKASKSGRGLAGGNEFTSDNWVALDNTQFKSAIGNVGSYGQRVPTAAEAKALGTTQKKAAELQEKGDIRYSLRAPTTPEFKQWFKGSKIVNPDGTPLVMYHSTTADLFSEFDTKKKSLMGQGTFFSSYPSNSFAEGEGGKTIPVYLSLKNPKFVDGRSSSDETYSNQDRLKKEGYDGLVISDDGEIKIAVAFEPDQVKSVFNQQPLSTGTKFSLRQQKTPEFKRFFGNSKITNPDGTPKVMYHGTARIIDEFIPKQAGAIFVTENPDFAETFSDDSLQLMVTEQKRLLGKKFADMSPDDQLQLLKKGYKLGVKQKAIKKADADKAMAAITEDFDNRKYPTNTDFNNVAEFFEEEIKNKLESGQNIMPLYVRAENPFDYENPKHIKALQDQAENQSLFPYSLPAGVKNGMWQSIESNEVQELIQEAGFDGFYVKEGGRKNLAVYNPNQIKSAIGNRGTYDETGRILYSLKNAPPNRYTKMTDDPALGKTISKVTESTLNAVRSDSSRTSARVQFIDTSAGLTDTLKSMPLFDTNGTLRADMLHHSKAQAQNLIGTGLVSGLPYLNDDGTIAIERSENNLARALDIADRLNTNPNVIASGLSGKELIAEVARSLRGADILAEDAETRALGEQQISDANFFTKELEKELKAGKITPTQVVQFQGQIDKLRKLGNVNRKMNRELQVKPEDIAWARKQLDLIPEVQEVLDIWKAVNTSLVTLYEETGMIDKETADKYRANKNYVPLFKSREDLDDSAFFRATGTKSTPKIKALEGADITRNIWENIYKQYAMMTAAAYENQTRRVSVEQMRGISDDLAIITTPDDKRVNLRYRDKGKDVDVIIENPNDLAAFQSMTYQISPVMKFLGGFTNVLRAGALLNPMFWIRQLIRDPIQATITGQSGIVTPFHSIKEFLMISGSPEAKLLAQRGVIGKIDNTQSLNEYLENVGTATQIAPNMIQKTFRKLLQIHEASDAATRVAIFKQAKTKALKDGMSEPQAVDYAVMKAREYINFAVTGNSPTLANLRQMIPFMNATIVGLDALYRAYTGIGLSPEERAKVRRTFRIRATMMVAMSVAYAISLQDDDDYKKLPDYVKDGNMLFPIGSGENKTFLKFSIPYEVGFLFKTLPELFVRYLAGNSTGKEVLASMRAGFIQNMPTGGTPVPQFAKPALEVMTNHSFFTNRPIEGMGDSRLPVAQRGQRASEFAKMMSGLGLDKVGLSPAKIDVLTKGYFAEFGTFFNELTDAFVATTSGTEKTPRNIENLPFMKAFLTDPQVNKAISDFYDIEKNATQVANLFSSYKSTGQGEMMREMIADPEKRMAIGSAPALRKISGAMSDIQKAIRTIDKDQSMAPAERRERINQLQQQLGLLAERGRQMAETIGLSR